MIPAHSKRYLCHGLAAQPTVLTALMNGVNPDRYDLRPEVDRFTLREVIAHLADWEGVWLGRMKLIISEENPFLQGYDEGQWAIDHAYHTLVPLEQLERYSAGRAEMVEFLRGMPDKAWERTGRHSEWGEMSIFNLASLVLGHDGYHMKQVVEWTTAG